MYIMLFRTILIFVLPLLILSCDSGPDDTMDPMDKEPIEMEPLGDTLRFASYNVSMFGNSEGQIASQLVNAEQYTRFRRIAAVIQSVRPDVLVLMEFDYDSTGESLTHFNDKLLSVSQNGEEGLNYPHRYQIVSNTGVLSEADLDNNGSIGLPDDAYGFGNFPGQYASAILSMYPLEIDSIRSFRKMLWKDMPNAALPVNTDGSSYFSDDALQEFRVSSKNHIDIPIVLSNGKKLHALISHPTPPVFDGVEDKNGRRNHDEIKLWSDYISNADYLVDDQGGSGGLSDEASFIVFGDQNADPNDGDSYNNAINQILNHQRVNQDVSNGSLIPSSNGGREHNQSSSHSGDPAYDTSFFGLRIDYVLPSNDLNAVSSGVYWPASSEPGHELIEDGSASDHLLVWVDLAL